MKKLILSVIAFMFLITVSSVRTEASDFDANYYAQRYPQVANTIGWDADALYKHYLSTGQKDGLFPNAMAEVEGTAKLIALQNAQASGNQAAIDELTKSMAAASAALQTQNQVQAELPQLQLPEATGLYGTYVDVNIASQTVTLFVNNVPMLSTPCVTGTPKNGRSTPVGSFYIKEKIPGKKLKGATWNVWVDRWMRFTDSRVGLHDASWRSKFGGNIYLTNGSHGCVNLPKDAAYQLYDMVSVGTPVIVH
ncbi:MAG: L,D-transpeptidase [Lachnospiraceae bacterium]|nr:L,D-transpeptidase [Lachnospiraceae bacterium]